MFGVTEAQLVFALPIIIVTSLLLAMSYALYVLLRGE
jgi:hypothetical protein